MTPYTLDEVETEIKNIYLWFHREAGSGVQAQETGRLGELWAIADRLYGEEADD